MWGPANNIVSVLVLVQVTNKGTRVLFQIKSKVGLFHCWKNIWGRVGVKDALRIWGKGRLLGGGRSSQPADFFYRKAIMITFSVKESSEPWIPEAVTWLTKIITCLNYEVRETSLPDKNQSQYVELYFLFNCLPFKRKSWCCLNLHVTRDQWEISTLAFVHQATNKICVYFEGWWLYAWGDVCRVATKSSRQNSMTFLWPYNKIPRPIYRHTYWLDFEKLPHSGADSWELRICLSNSMTFCFNFKIPWLFHDPLQS